MRQRFDKEYIKSERMCQELEVLQAFNKFILWSELKVKVNFSSTNINETIKHLTEKDIIVVEGDVIVWK